MLTGRLGLTHALGGTNFELRGHGIWPDLSQYPLAVGCCPAAFSSCGLQAPFLSGVVIDSAGNEGSVANLVPVSDGDQLWCHVLENGLGHRCLPDNAGFADHYWHLYHHR